MFTTITTITLITLTAAGQSVEFDATSGDMVAHVQQGMDISGGVPERWAGPRITAEFPLNPAPAAMIGHGTWGWSTFDVPMGLGEGHGLTLGLTTNDLGFGANPVAALTARGQVRLGEVGFELAPVLGVGGRGEEMVVMPAMRVGVEVPVGRGVMELTVHGEEGGGGVSVGWGRRD